VRRDYAGVPRVLVLRRRDSRDPLRQR
jgi:hypothetical protein